MMSYRKVKEDDLNPSYSEVVFYISHAHTPNQAFIKAFGGFRLGVRTIISTFLSPAITILLVIVDIDGKAIVGDIGFFFGYRIEIREAFMIARLVHLVASTYPFVYDNSMPAKEKPNRNISPESDWKLFLMERESCIPVMLFARIEGSKLVLTCALQAFTFSLKASISAESCGGETDALFPESCRRSTSKGLSPLMLKAFRLTVRFSRSRLEMLIAGVYCNDTMLGNKKKGHCVVL